MRYASRKLPCFLIKQNTAPIVYLIPKMKGKTKITMIIHNR
jgi:hypothetical protein